MNLFSLNSVIRTLPRTFLLPLAALAVLPGTQAQPATNIRLTAPSRGAAAIAALGEHLPDVARAYGLEAQGLATLLQTQPSLGVDQSGSLLFICDGLSVDARSLHAKGPKSESSDALTTSSSTSQLVAGNAVDAFQLHSLPGATRVIYLDFDGQTTSNTSWNGGATIISAPFDLDGDPTTFNAQERAMIQAIWKRVAEDYAPFAIDVTTQDPGVEALRKSTSTDNAYGIRVVISPTNWYDAGAGGTAYIGSFNWNSDTPCWVFTQQLGNGEKYIAEAISHEVGHTVGLYHDGVGGSSPSEYYFGQGSWAPIMGVGYYAAITQFSKGDYANATNTQDDYAVISGTYAPLATDDHGNTTTAATTLTGPTVASGGTIETRADVDVFRFDTGAGAIALNIASPSVETDLHLKAELLNASGQVILANDASSFNASFSPTLAAGTYYLRLSGIGYGDPLVSGYSDYGSVGNYIITGTLVGLSGLQAPVARVTASVTSGTTPLTVAFSGQGSSDGDGTIVSYSWDFGNGSTSTAMNPACTYMTAGTFIAVLTVTDNDGMANSASVAITASAPANQLPVAVASASTTSGLAPLPVNFSSSGSSDPDGTIASYLWAFGDGTTSTAASPAKTYSTPGTYTVKLTVTDNAGATGSATTSVTVSSDPNSDIDVNQHTIARTTSNSGVSALDTVVVLDAKGRAVAGATVTIQWSGVVTGTTSGKTDATGTVKLSSSRSKKTGTITGTIKSVTPPAGLTYRSSLYSAPDALSITTK
ncbi:PKD domain-containing protein [Horticoccus sp. 23ND18S-11]|uniref:PKD domain-containing protein n=1 Tax=Horticoccus sp. 23ND18S-11 TaxID=3391832 RepID=UPI0039C97FC0